MKEEDARRGRWYHVLAHLGCSFVCFSIGVARSKYQALRAAAWEAAACLLRVTCVLEFDC
jgi:hypothetical protein